MPAIVLATLNARYSHASFGLRYLRANLGPLLGQSALLEFTIHDQAGDIVERILAERPAIVGLGVYIWNVRQTTEVAAQLRAVAPEVKLVLGGPEISHEYEGTLLFSLADHLVTGEADLAFRDLAAGLLEGRPAPKVIAAAPPDPAALVMPYAEYSDEDLRQRIVYVEASRGCPFSCEFCLSSLEVPVRAFALAPFLAALDGLLARGARAFKFVDRTFNLNTQVSRAILEFCLARVRPGFELHFEMVPDRLPEELRAVLRRFPPGVVQLEIGIQTFTPEVAARISRKQNYARTAENFRFVRDETHAHIHADLIVGLPGETLAEFAASFDQLHALRPQEIQLGILKRLKGTPIDRHTRAFGMVYSPMAPYEVLQTAAIAFADMQRMKRFARYFELYVNHGDFDESAAVLFALPAHGSAFAAFLAFADWLWARTRQTHQFQLARLYALLFTYLTGEHGVEPRGLAQQLLRDYDRRKPRKERLEFLRPHVPEGPLVATASP
jgi:radical SAM superfamily enzyme YgiQ (UPF0313 family)